MNDFLKATLEANLEISKALNGTHKSEWYDKKDIGAGGDVSCGLDLFAENIFFEHLSSFGSIESEESGVMNSGNIKIIIDPIDGSDNAISKMPYFGTSVAMLDEFGILQNAMICNLSTSEYFFVSNDEKPKYGKLNSAKIETTSICNTSKIGIFERAYANPDIVKVLNDNSIKFRSPGAVALSLAYAHFVDFVLFVGPIRIYDVAAGLALCKELEVIINDDYVIVSKDKDIAFGLEKILGGMTNKEK